MYYNKLKIMRKEKGMTLEELAEKDIISVEKLCEKDYKKIAFNNRKTEFGRFWLWLSLF